MTSSVVWTDPRCADLDALAPRQPRRDKSALCASVRAGVVCHLARRQKQADQRKQAGQLRNRYKRHACLICGHTGWCCHREPEVELAILEGRGKRRDALLG